MFVNAKTCLLLATPVSLLILGLVNSRAQGASTLADTVVSLSHPKLKYLLSQPGGLAQAASQAGRLIVESYNAPAKTMTLSGLAASSDGIVLCKVLSRSSAVDSTSNIVTTRVHLQVDERLKGSIPRDAYVNIPGGFVAFGPNALADVRTVETKGVGDGHEVLLFLLRTADPATFAPTNGMEGIFWVSLTDGFVTSVTKYDGHNHVVQSLSMTLASLRNQLALAGGVAN